MFRYKAIIEYNGSYFVGWQKQPGLCSVQSVIENSIRAFCGKEINVFCAGRTDSGVHALGQVIHFDLPKEESVHTIQHAINFHMKEHAVAIIFVEMVNLNFHARFSALQRHYEYRILNRDVPPVLNKGKVWHIKKCLNINNMIEGGKFMEGRHDFSSFRSAHCQAENPTRTIEEIRILSNKCDIKIKVRAKSFLHNQVRIMVGTLVQAGLGAINPGYINHILEKKDRSLAGPTAPAFGLFFCKVDY